MAYPFAPDSWADPIGQSIYAGVVLLIFQAITLALWRLLKWIRRGGPTPKFISLIGWAGLLVPPIIVLGLVLFRRDLALIVAMTLVASVVPSVVAATRAYLAQSRMLEAISSKLARFSAIGVDDVVVNPDIEAYRKFLTTATSAFAFQGVGAEKLTRDFAVFQAMVSRCGTLASPVRLLMVSPDASWLQDGAARRGLGRASFSDRQAQSLQRVARIRNEFSGHILVRFYAARPVFRMMFANRAVCWLGHYTESAAMPGQNEYAEQSNSSVVLGKPEAQAPDQQLYGALETYFEEQWKSARRSEWDFKRFLN